MSKEHLTGLKVTIEKQSDGGYVLTHPSGNSAYCGGIDGIVKLLCAVYEYPANYLIEDLTFVNEN